MNCRDINSEFSARWKSKITILSLFRILFKKFDPNLWYITPQFQANFLLVASITAARVSCSTGTDRPHTPPTGGAGQGDIPQPQGEAEDQKRTDQKVCGTQQSLACNGCFSQVIFTFIIVSLFQWQFDISQTFCWPVRVLWCSGHTSYCDITTRWYQGCWYKG